MGLRSGSGSFLPLVVAISLQVVCRVNGHGRLFEPVGRSTMWRLPAYQDLDPPVNENFDDDQLYCGSLGNMISNGGKCGVCGDSYSDPRPRANENTGLYGESIIVRNYKVGQVIDVSVELTTNHWGYFTFNLCKLEDPSAPEPEDCFDKYPLTLADGSGHHQYNLTQNTPGWYNTTVKLPAGLQCDHCVLQWHYRAGNNWEFCDDTGENGSTTCGIQEVFRGCSDIGIGSRLIRPMRPKLTTTTYPTEESAHPTNKATIPPMRPPVFGL